MTKKLMMLCAAVAITAASCTKPSPLTTKTGNSQNGENTGNTTQPPYNIEEGCGDTAPIDCEGVVCTQEFRMIYLDVKNSAGATVTLTSFYTEDMAGNKLPAALYEYDSWRDAYMVFNDAWVNGSNKVVDEVYTIATDCCHIDKIAGKDKVVLP